MRRRELVVPAVGMAMACALAGMSAAAAETVDSTETASCRAVCRERVFCIL